MTSNPTALSLYRRSLKLSLDWAVNRYLWRGQAVYIRSLFDANKDIREPRQQKILFQETEKLLDAWKHPDPYKAPTAPGGSKYERNLEAPILNEPVPQHIQVQKEIESAEEDLKQQQEESQQENGLPLSKSQIDELRSKLHTSSQ